MGRALNGFNSGQFGTKGRNPIGQQQIHNRLGVCPDGLENMTMYDTIMIVSVSIVVQVKDMVGNQVPAWLNVHIVQRMDG